jgi:thiol-disulfide isomerase/thioredoxin
MNWKLITVGFVGLVLLAFVSYTFKNSISSFVRQGFQNPTTSPSVKEFILYYADWCPHCKPVIPEFDKLAPNGEVIVGGEKVKVSKYEVSKEPEKHKAANVSGYPTIKFSDVDGTTTEYKGSRTAEAFLEFLNEKLGGGI